MRQLNLTKVFELKDCEGNDINLLDQTFSGLLMDDCENTDPSFIKKPLLNVPSPNSIINNKYKNQIVDAREK